MATKMKSKPKAKKKPARGGTKKPVKRGKAKKAVKRAARPKTRARKGASRKAGAKAAKSRARAAAVMPVGGEGKSSASGRMHRVPRGRMKELSASKPRPAGATRQQRMKATNEQGLGFKQIEERYTAPEKTGVAADRRKSVREVDEELEADGVEQGKPAAGFVDYDKQERTPDADEEEKVDFVAPAATEEE